MPGLVWPFMAQPTTTRTLAVVLDTCGCPLAAPADDARPTATPIAAMPHSPTTAALTPPPSLTFPSRWLHDLYFRKTDPGRARLAEPRNTGISSCYSEPTTAAIACRVGGRRPTAAGDVAKRRASDRNAFGSSRQPSSLNETYILTFSTSSKYARFSYVQLYGERSL